MNIGIVEFLYHHVFLYSLARVAKESGSDVTIFTTSNLYNLVIPLFRNKVSNYRWIIKREDEKLLSFLKRVEKFSNKEIDLLFVNTLQRKRYYPLYLLFNPKCKSILVTGRATDWFGSKYRLLPFRSIKSFLTHNIKHFVYKKILPRYDAIVVHTQRLKDYVLQRNYKKDIFVLPFTIYEGSATRSRRRKKIRLIVLGSIANHRRDYDGLLRAFEILCSSTRKEISLTLLGRPIGKYGERIISRCKLLRERGFDLQFYNEYISEELFKKKVMSADIIINPIKLENYSFGGFTSGLVEAIRHAKPEIYPLDYAVPDELASSSLFYSEINELPQLIKENFLNNNHNNQLYELSEKARINSEKFSLEKLAKYFKESILRKYCNI